MGLNTRGTYVYRSDDGSDYLVSMDDSNAAATGFVAAASPTNDSTPNLPTGYTMRQINCYRSANNGRRRVPCPQPTSTKFVDGGTIDLAEVGVVASQTYVITSAIGEKRRFRTF